MFAHTFSSLDSQPCSPSPVAPLPALNGCAPIAVPSRCKSSGIDLAYEHEMPAFVPAFAVSNGVIAYAGKEPQGGYAMIVDHGNGWATYYANLEHMFARSTSTWARARAERVKAGDVLGYVGAPSSGAPRSLHFQLWKRADEDRFEPVDVLSHLHRRGARAAAQVPDRAASFHRRPSMNTTTAAPAIADPSASSAPECMCADQLARFLGVNRKTVYEYAARNVIPHRRLGRRIVFSRTQVVSWLGACNAGAVRKGD